MSECCKSGFQWAGTPVGKTTKVANLDTYVAGESSSKDRAILIISDIFGWTLPNVRLLADQYAQETSSTVFVPDFFGGEVIDPDAMSDPEKKATIDIGAFLGRNSKDIRWPEILAVTKKLRSDGYKKLAAIGFCYGGVCPSFLPIL